jgi:uncharacterized repeat protein (TIGR01451 family)
MTKNCVLIEGGLSPRRGESFFGFALLGIVLFFSTLAAHGQGQTLRGHIPAVTAKLRPLGQLAESNRISLIISLPLRNKAVLSGLLAQIYNPASANFHHYLTATQFAEGFGPTVEDYQAVMDFAASHGLRVTGTHSNRTLLDVNGTVADIQNAFHLRLRLYQHPVEARTFFAPDAEPSVDLSVPLLEISGLNNYILPHPLITKAAQPRPLQPQTGSGTGGTYIGNDFRAAYVPGTSLTGTGQSVGLWEGDGYDASDIASYEAQAGLPDVPLQNVYIDGATGQAGSGASEVSLDIEMTISMAPGLASVIVYEGPDEDNVTVPNDILNRMATDNLAKQLSCSWGFSVNSTTDQIFQQYAAQGQSFFLASGDSGAFVNPDNPVEPPSDDPYITVVGATTLNTSGPGGAWESETVWNWYTTGEGKGASSGGISPTYAIPSWQAPVSMADNQGSAIMRNFPDVAMVGDNVWVIYGGGQTGNFGGTSCAAPLWAGFTALVNQQGSNYLEAPVGFVNPAIYAIGLSPNYSSTFHDITTGNNTNTYTHSFFFAVPGYDLCTGWGTPASTNLINLLAPPSNTPILSGTATLIAESCLPTNGAVDPGETVTVNLALTDFGAVSTTNLVAALQSNVAVIDPSGPQTYGIVTGGGAAVSRPFTFTAGGICGQIISAVWQLQDGTDNLGTVTVNFALGALVPNVTFSQNFDSVTPPALPAGWSNVLSGQQVDWVTTTASFDTGPNSAFATDVAVPGVAYLVGPAISVLSSNAQLTFRQNYNLEYATTTHHHGETETSYYDGGVLEINMGANGFNDIISAGGSFVTGGYVGTIYAESGNPLAGRQAWSGDSGGWVTATVNLPSAAAGQTIQLRWGCGTDEGNQTPVVGWYVDTISLQDAYYACCGDSANLAVTQVASPSLFVPGQAGTYTLTVSNTGPDLAADVTVTDMLPAGVTLISASPGAVVTNGNIIYSVGNLAAGASSVVTVVVSPGVSGVVTNTVSAASITANSNPTNTSILLTSVSGGSVTAPVLSPGSAAVTTNGFSLSVPSAAGLTYVLQYKNSLTDAAWTNVPGAAVGGTGGVIVLQDNSIGTDRFYRVAVE